MNTQDDGASRHVKNWIKNFDAIATSEKRKTALSIMSAGFDAIDTKHVIRAAISLSGSADSTTLSDPRGEILRIKGQSYELAKFDAIRIIGFGKVVCEAVATLESILGDRIKSGIVIGTEAAVCNHVESFAGSHPSPSHVNVKASGDIVNLAKSMTERDLVIVIVSGGGSSLLCWPPEECEQGQRLYEDFLKTGCTIEEINTVRKHISLLKGGGLATMLCPATVVGLIFSDVPGHGEAFDAVVASGPTYFDSSTVADAERVLKKYGLDVGKYILNETPKDRKCFEKVFNVPLVSNYDALSAMAEYGQKHGMIATILSSTLYDPPAEIVRAMFEKAAEMKKINAGNAGNSSSPRKNIGKQLILAGGEPKMEVPTAHGKGGRDTHTTLEAVHYMESEAEKNKKNDEVNDISDAIFISFASDGHDNTTAAGAIADSETLAKVKTTGLSAEKYLAAFDTYSFFEKTGDLIVTGQTETNVSDLMLLLTD